MQLLRNHLVSKPARNEVGYFSFTHGELMCDLMRRRRRHKMLKNIVIDPLSASRHRAYTFDEVAVADDVQQQAVGIEFLYA